MKSKILLIFIVAFVVLGNISNGADLSFRVQCFPSNYKNQLDVINDIPEKMKYLMPGGKAIYFSGDYFSDYMDAKARLNEIQGVGFNQAFIRVFVHRRLVSKPVGNSYINKEETKLGGLLVVKTKDDSRSRKGEFNEKVLKKRFVFKEEKAKPIVAKKKYTREEYNQFKLNKLKKQLTQQSDSLLNSELEKISSVLVNNNVLTVDEKPIFKIQVEETFKGSGASKRIQKLNDVLYSYQEGKRLIFAVGYFSSPSEARGNLSKYSKKGFDNAKVIGVYKGKVVSEGLGRQLLEEFNKIEKD